MCSQQLVNVKKLMEDYLRSKGWTTDIGEIDWWPAEDNATALSLANAYIEQLERDNKEK